ncbi:MAG: hypothetical protein AAFN77_18660 [Planctomycetota bacterium]
MSRPTFIQGQSAVPVAPQESATPTATPAGPTANQAAGAEAAAPPQKSLDEKRVEALLKVKFDRTPAGILKAWSTKAEENKNTTEAKKEEQKPIRFEVANSFRGFLVGDVDDASKLKPNQIVELHRPPVGEAKEANKEANKEAGKEAGKEASKEASKDADQDAGKESSSAKPYARLKILSIEGKQVSARIVPAAPKPSTKPIQKDPGFKEPPTTDGPAATPGEKPSGESAVDQAPATSKSDAPASKPAASTPTKQPEAENETEPSEQTTAEKEAANADDTKTEDKEAKLATSDDEQAVAESSDEKNLADDRAVDLPELKVGDKFVLSIPAALKAAKEASEDELVQSEIKEFSRNVTLGNWAKVKSYLGKLKDKNKADDVYDKILKALVTAMPNVTEQQAARQRSQMQQRGETLPSSFLTPEDLLALTEAAPKPISIIPPEEEKEDAKDEANRPNVSSATAAPSAVQLPPNVTLPPNAPPELIAALQQQMAQQGGVLSGAPAAAAATTTKQNPSRHLSSLTQLISKSKTAGFDFANFVQRIEKGTTHFGGEDQAKRLTASHLLINTQMYDDAEKFLPLFETVDELNENHQLVALQQWSQLSGVRYSQLKNAKWLELSWNVSQKILGHEKAKEPQKSSALTRLIELSTIVDAEIGQTWLDESFTKSPERGMKILANLGSKSSENARKAAQVSESQRIKMLRMQNSAVEKYLELTPEIEDSMNAMLTLLAQNWVTESDVSIENSQETSRNGYMSIDMYGNYYWRNSSSGFSGRRKKPIKIGDMLEIVPSQKWLELVDPTLLTEVKKVQANLHLRINEEDKAFPFIEALAESHPDIARDLVHEFLKIWTKNHDPNTDRRQRNPYIYMYGFDQKAESIPLTRSKQERNLAELTEWISRIRKMPIKDVDEKLLAQAFTTCHSTAEVYKLDRVKSVFGDLTKLEPKTIAELAQTMRTNLTTVWRQVKVQEAKQTQRKLPEVQQEVIQGYATAKAMVDEALTAAPENWQLQLARACILYDENAYAQSVKKSSKFSDNRDLAFEEFAKAAALYAKEAALLDKKKQSTDAFDRWFYAALGAVDLGQIKAENQPDKRQFAKIRAALDALPGEIAKDHMGKFANNLFTRMSPIKPELKFRYLKGGFEIVGDHPRAWEAKSLYEYYKDLVTEITLDVQIDGDEVVGTQEFGLYVNLKHTPEIEREAGGFAKYVQNQNNMMYAFNYGRPTEDYRDKFRDGIDQAFEEHFEVISVTFESADRMKSRAAPGGWRVTPYAYVMLKARGTEVDRVPPMKLDLDFLDTSGYVVIPIESPALVIDAVSEGTVRPIEDLRVTQTLDERQANEGKLILEVSASGKGLIPNLDEIIELKTEDFEVVEIDDQGSLPTTFDEEGNKIQIVSDRSWTVEYRAKDAARKANKFAFGEIKRDTSESKFQRYEDADLVAAEPLLTLSMDYANGGTPIWYWLAPLAAVVLIGLGIVAWVAQPKEVVKQRSFEVPEEVNPFTVLSLLKDIKHRNGISDQQAGELQQSISRIESYYFGERADDEPDDLENVARTWVSKAK